MLNYQFSQSKSDRMELEYDQADDNQFSSYPVFPGGWPYNGSNFLSIPLTLQQPPNTPFSRAISPNPIFFPHFRTPLENINKIQKQYLYDSPRNEFDNADQHYQHQLTQNISPFDPTEYKSPSPQKNPQNTPDKRDRNLLNCSFGNLEGSNEIIEGPNQEGNRVTETREPSFHNDSGWCGDEPWGGDSPNSFGKPPSILDLGTSLSLNNEEEIEVQGNQDSLNDLSSILEPLAKELAVAEESKQFQEEYKTNTRFKRFYDHIGNVSNFSEEFEVEHFQKKVKGEKLDWRKKVEKVESLQDLLNKNWESLPGKIIKGVKRGCRFYFTQSKGIKLECVLRVLSNKPIETQRRFQHFIMSLRPKGKTWDDITAYLHEQSDNEITLLLTELVYELLSSKEDLEVWMANTKMSTKTKNYLRIKKDMFKDRFIYYLYPRG